MVGIVKGSRGSAAMLAVLASCGTASEPRPVAGMSAVVMEDSAVFVMPSGWDDVPPPPPAAPGQSRLDYGWAVLVPSRERYEISAHRFTTDSIGGRGTPLERLIAPSRLCVCTPPRFEAAHAHRVVHPPRVPREVTVRASGDDVVLTLKAAPAVQRVFGARPTHVWFRRYLRWPRADSVRVPVRNTSAAAPRAPDQPHSHD